MPWKAYLASACLKFGQDLTVLLSQFGSARCLALCLAFWPLSCEISEPEESELLELVDDSELLLDVVSEERLECFCDWVLVATCLIAPGVPVA